MNKNPRRKDNTFFFFVRNFSEISTKTLEEFQSRRNNFFQAKARMSRTNLKTFFYSNIFFLIFSF